MPGYSFGGLRADAGGYVLYGTHGKPKEPAAAGSRDGKTWVAAATPDGEFTGCTAQGCLAPGGWADLSGNTPASWAVPGDPAELITLSWAVNGETFCRFSAVLRCRTGRSAWTKPKPVAPPTPTSQNAWCIHCPTPPYPDRSRYNGRHGDVRLKAIIGTNGVFRQLLVAAAPSAALAAAAMATVRTWTYHPLMSNGKPMEVHTTINVNFQLRH